MRLAFFLSLLAINVSAMNWFGLTAKQLMAGAPDVDEAYADALIKHMQMMKKEEMDLTVTEPMPKGTEKPVETTTTAPGAETTTEGGVVQLVSGLFMLITILAL